MSLAGEVMRCEVIYQFSLVKQFIVLKVTKRENIFKLLDRQSTTQRCQNAASLLRIWYQ